MTTKTPITVIHQPGSEGGDTPFQQEMQRYNSQATAEQQFGLNPDGSLPPVKPSADQFGPPDELHAPGGSGQVQIPQVEVGDDAPWLQFLGDLGGTARRWGQENLVSAPREIYEYARSNFSYDPTNALTINDEGQWDTQFAFPWDREESEDLPSPFMSLFPRKQELRENLYENTGEPEHVATGPGGRIYQAGVTGVTAAPLGPEAALASGGGAAMGQGLRETGLVSDDTATLAEVGLGMLTPGSLTKTASAGKNLVFLGVPEEQIAKAAKVMKPHEIDAAETLMLKSINQGSPVSFAEAASTVTNGRVKSLLNLQRYVEPNSPDLQETMAARPGANRTMMTGQNEAIAGGPLPTGSDRAALPRQLGDNANKYIRNVQGERTAEVSPLYKSALGAPIEDVMTPHLPAYQEILQRPAVKAALTQAETTMKNTGKLNKTKWYTTDDAGNLVSIDRVPELDEIDAMVKDLNAQAYSGENVDKFGKPNARGQGILSAAADFEKLAEDTIPGYAEARARHAELSGPVTDKELGPAGVMAQATGSAEERFTTQMQALLPHAPKITDAATARTVIRGMTRNRFGVIDAGKMKSMQQAVGTYLMDKFNEAAKTTLTDPRKQTGGAMFKHMMMGNDEQAKILRTVVEELQGSEVLDGFNNAMEILDAQSFRQAPGSQTAYNMRFGQEMEQPKFAVGPEHAVGGALSVGTSIPVQIAQSITEKFQILRHTKNAEAVGKLLLDPAGAAKWRALAKMDPKSPNALRLLDELLGAAMGSAANQGDPAAQPDPMEGAR